MSAGEVGVAAADGAPQEASSAPTGVELRPPDREGTLRQRSAGTRLGGRVWTARGHLAVVRWGLIGQIFTVAAMLAPILLRESDQVTWLVVASSIATLLNNPAILAYPFLYPVLRGPATARAATRAALASLLTVSLLVAAATPLEDRLSLPPGLLASSALLLFAGAVFTMSLSSLVRAGDPRWFGIARFVYGLTLLPLTLAFGAVRPLGVLSLVVASALANLVGAAAVLARREARPHGGGMRAAVSGPRPAVPGRLVRGYVVRALRPTAASMANAWALFVPGLALPGLGAAAAPWAVVTRIGGGFSTVLTTLVSPSLEARMSRAIRERDIAAFTEARRSALIIGALAATAAVGAGLTLAVYASGLDEALHWLVPVVVATVLFWGSLLTGTVVNRVPNFLGRDTSRLLWDVSRAVLMTGALLAPGVSKIVVMGAVLAATGVILLPMTRYRTGTVNYLPGGRAGRGRLRARPGRR
jgi:hypothetical protein